MVKYKNLKLSNNMKKISLLALLLSASTVVFAQKSNVQNAFRALEKGNIAEAVEYIELAATNSKTANDVKMHDYRGEIYFEVHTNVDYSHLDAMAAFKCAESWEAVAKHPKAKKWFDKDEINTKITNAGVALFNKAAELYYAGNHQSALDHFNKIFDLFLWTKKEIFQEVMLLKKVYGLLLLVLQLILMTII